MASSQVPLLVIQHMYHWMPFIGGMVSVHEVRRGLQFEGPHTSSITVLCTPVYNLSMNALTDSFENSSKGGFQNWQLLPHFSLRFTLSFLCFPPHEHSQYYTGYLTQIADIHTS